MKILTIFAVVFIIGQFVRAESDKISEVYLMGAEEFDPRAATQFAKKYQGKVIYKNKSTDLKSNSSTAKPLQKLSASENTESLKGTLQSFQDSIKGLCISQVELSLAFSVSAKAWVVVDGSVNASVKVVVKNTNEVCK